MSLEQRSLGSGGSAVNAISYGMMSLGHAHGFAGDMETRLKFLDELFKLGLTTWDSADVYADTEELIGEWLARNPDKRKKVFIATKCGAKREPPWANSSPDYIRTQCASSLRKLRVECIDLYYVHRVDDVTPIEKTMEALAELQKQGKIRHIGLSEVSARTLERACKVAPVNALQVEYSPFTLDIERSQNGQKSVLDTCRNLDITIFAYSPLGRGFLTGAMQQPPDANDARSRFPPFAKENFESNMQLVKAITKITEEIQLKQPEVTQSQVVLAWLLAQWEGVIPLFGSKNLQRAKENIGAARIQLKSDEIKAVRSAAEALKKLGDRYPADYNHLCLRDTPELEQ